MMALASMRMAMFHFISSLLRSLAARAGADVYQIDALLVAQFAGGKSEFAQWNLRNEARLERITDVKSGADRLPCVGRVGQLVLFVGNIEQAVVRVGP